MAFGAEMFLIVFVSVVLCIKLMQLMIINLIVRLTDVDCGQPPEIENGKVVLATNFTYYGAAAHYECKANFKLDGVSRR